MKYIHKVDMEEIKGEIEISLLPWKERMSKAKEIVYKIVDGNYVDRHEIEQGEATIDLAISRVASVNLKATDIEIKSIDELMFYREGSIIVNEISRIVLNGLSLGKK